MTIILDGTNGVSDVDGSAATPAVRGTDANTGIFFPAADTVGIATGGSERVRVDSSGNVGIGTNSPSYKLDVNGEVRTTSHVRGTGGDILYLIGGASNNNNNIYIGGTSASTANTIAFTTNGSERARITSGGDLLVGTTSTLARFTLRSSGSDSGSWTAQFEAADGTDQFGVRSDGATYMGLDGASPYNLTTATAANATLLSDGFLYRSTSSLKYKRDVADATHGLAEVMQLRPVTYKGKSEADGDKVFGGLIAEEVHAVGLTEFVQYGEDGSPDALAYGNMVSLLTKAIQEQQALIQQLTERVAALEAKGA